MVNAMRELSSSKLWLINFYHEQLSKFYKLGVGRKTEHGVLITDKLINNTKKRLEDLSVIYEANVSDQAAYQRRLRDLRKEQESGQSSNTNGTTIMSRK